MSAPKHTADWSVSCVRVTIDGQQWLRVIDGASREKSREIAYVPFGDRRPEDYRLCMSDARLIAAAPDLLEALQRSHEGLQRLGEFFIGDRPHTAIIDALLKANAAAIAKATGEAAS